MDDENSRSFFPDEDEQDIALDTNARLLVCLDCWSTKHNSLVKIRGKRVTVGRSKVNEAIKF